MKLEKDKLFDAVSLPVNEKEILWDIIVKTQDLDAATGYLGEV